MMDVRRQRLALCLCLLSACGGARSLSASSWPVQLSAVRTLDLGEPAARYETAVPSGAPTFGSEGRALADAVARVSASYRRQLIGDPRLARLAQWVASQLTPAGKLPPQAALDQAAHHLGLTEPTPHIVLLAGSDARVVMERFEVRLRAAFADQIYSHWGGAALTHDGSSVAIVALAFRFIELEAIGREVPAGATIELRGALTHGFGTPQLAVTRPDGSVVRGPAGTSAAFTFRVPTEQRGIYRVEVFGDGPSGVAPVANFPVYAGVAAPSRIDVAPRDAEPPLRDMRQAAQRLLELANRERARAGLAPLAAHAALAEVAARHVDDMLEHHFVGHTSKLTGSPAQRVKRAGIRSDLVLENIGRGASLGDVHTGLMESPGHRGSILHPLATHAGIAVAAIPQTDPDEPASEQSLSDDYLVTQLFVRMSAPLASDAPSQLMAAINSARRDAGAPPLREDSALSRVATRAAQGCFGAKPDDDALTQRVHDELVGEAQRTGVRGIAVTLASSVAELAKLEALRAPELKRLGLGVAQGDRPDALPGSLCAVFVLAQ